jgi:hypothetical protein
MAVMVEAALVSEGLEGSEVQEEALGGFRTAMGAVED